MQPATIFFSYGATKFFSQWYCFNVQQQAIMRKRRINSGRYIPCLYFDSPYSKTIFVENFLIELNSHNELISNGFIRAILDSDSQEPNFILLVKKEEIRNLNFLKDTKNPKTDQFFIARKSSGMSFENYLKSKLDVNLYNLNRFIKNLEKVNF